MNNTGVLEERVFPISLKMLGQSETSAVPVHPFQSPQGSLSLTKPLTKAEGSQIAGYAEQSAGKKPIATALAFQTAAHRSYGMQNREIIASKCPACCHSSFDCASPLLPSFGNGIAPPRMGSFAACKTLSVFWGYVKNESHWHPGGAYPTIHTLMSQSGSLLPFPRLLLL